MRISGLTQQALGLSLIVMLLAGCNSAGTALSLSSPQIQNTEKSRVDSRRGRSWMDPNATRDYLLYVSSNALGDKSVYVFSYGKGSLVGTLTAFADPQGMCADKAGDVFITDTSAMKIYEYAHGGTNPIATLSDPNGSPQGCSVDRATGNLAVADIEGYPSSQGNIAIYAGASGTPTYYTDSGTLYRPFSCSYDNSGNLFIVGAQPSGQFQLGELLKGSSNIADIALNQHINSPGGVQWDGKYVAVSDDGNGYLGTAVYEFTVSGSSGTLEGTTSFPNLYGINQFWLGPRTTPKYPATRIVAADYRGNSNDIGIYNYPAGGTPRKTIMVGAGGLFGATVSKPKK